MIKNIKSHNIILYCKNFHEAIIFYRDTLGLPVSMEKSWLTEFRVTEKSFITAADERKAGIKSGGGLGITITLRVDDADDIHGRLSVQGMATSTVEDYPPGARRFFLHDPEGNRIEIWSERDQE